MSSWIRGISEDGDFVIIDRMSYEFSEPKRGDIITFGSPDDYPPIRLIKRIIALPNETIQIQNNTVIIKNKEYPNGFILLEPYLDKPFCGTIIASLGDREYFVMGDNRKTSLDSRAWGAIPRQFIIGRALFISEKSTQTSLLNKSIIVCPSIRLSDIGGF
ncbi:MAG: signal peptidase I [Parcubacteria group bacterium]|nr:signal peptidase I [Parcubacteria group bacterium]